jgi:hypothetical protein
MSEEAMWHTQNDLPEKIRRGAIKVLNQQLDDALDLALQAKQAHCLMLFHGGDKILNGLAPTIHGDRRRGRRRPRLGKPFALVWVS